MVAVKKIVRYISPVYVSLISPVISYIEHLGAVNNYFIIKTARIQGSAFFYSSYKVGFEFHNSQLS